MGYTKVRLWKKGDFHYLWRESTPENPVISLFGASSQIGWNPGSHPRKNFPLPCAHCWIRRRVQSHSTVKDQGPAKNKIRMPWIEGFLDWKPYIFTLPPQVPPRASARRPLIFYGWPRAGNLYIIWWKSRKLAVALTTLISFLDFRGFVQQLERFGKRGISSII